MVFARDIGQRVFQLQPARGSFPSYLIALALVGIALSARLMFAPVDAGYQYVTFFPAIALAAISGGIWPGLFAAFLGAAFAVFLFTAPYHALSLEAIDKGFWSVVVFLLGGVIVSSSIESMHRYRSKATKKLQAMQAQNNHIRQLQQDAERLLQRNQSLMMNSMDGIYIMDIRGNIIEANDALCRMLGYTQEEIIRLSVVDLDALHTEEDLREQFTDLIGTSMMVETLHRCKNGDLINVEVSISGVMIEKQALIFSSSRNVTERKKAELELRDREALLNAVMKGLPVGVWVTDKEGKIVFGNDCGQKILAGSHYVKRDTKVGRFMEQPNLRPECGESIALLETGAAQAIGRGDIPVENEIEITCADGTRKTVLSIAHSYCGNDSGIIGAIIVNQDITGRKQAEEAKLQESDLRFRGTLEQVAVGIIHASLDGRYQQVNQKFCEIIGYSQEELLQMSFREITFLPDSAGEETHLLQLLSGKISNFSREQCYVRKNRSLVWVNLTVSLLRKTDDSPAYYIGVVEDIAERKHAELLAQQYGYLLENSFNEIYLFDAHSLHFLLTSEGAERNLGYSDDELRQLTPLDLKPFFTRDSFEQILAPLRSGKQHSLNFETTHLRKDGSTYPVEVRLQLMNADNPVFMAVIQDTSERKQADAELNQSRNLLRDLVAQGESLREEERKRIAREVHDELGQLLTALRMNIALLRIEFGDHNAALQEKIKKSTELLDKAIKCTRDVVSNLRPVALDMGVVSAIRWLCDEFAKHTGTHCVLYAPDEEIHLDENLSVAAFRVAQESLTNVARYAEASKVEVTLTQDAESFSVTINDNGKGFDYMDISNHKSYGLLGMRERALALGGVVNIYSSPQQGTQIFFVIPNTSSST